ncbi:hypothetical protein ACFV0O_22070 [Kitasatospora sp. NPDC059577]|uniref:hypothetical protein n=1 Tax=unclassified Kitasatospora TaxID=2633591 RepID=UPI0036AF5C33
MPPAPEQSPAPGQAEEVQVALPDLRHCVAALGVPPEQADTAVDRLHRTGTEDGPLRPSPVTAPPDRLAELEAFAVHLRCFARPEQTLLRRKLYPSRGKLDETYGPLGHRLGVTDHPAERFRLLHRHLAAQRRLAFGPALLLSGEALPGDDTSWLYFHGTFSLTDATRSSMARAVGARRWGKGTTAGEVAAEIFLSPDPRTVPLLEFEGSIGPHRVSMVLSRGYLPYDSLTYGHLTRVVDGREPVLRGFGTVDPADDEIRPIVLRAYGPRYD